MSQVASLKNQVLSRLLFEFEVDEGVDGIQQVSLECLMGIYGSKRQHSKLSDREWGIPTLATPFQKLKAAFDSVRDVETLPITEEERADLVGHYQALRKQKVCEEFSPALLRNPLIKKLLLKESRIIQFRAVSG